MFPICHSAFHCKINQYRTNIFFNYTGRCLPKAQRGPLQNHVIGFQRYKIHFKKILFLPHGNHLFLSIITRPHTIRFSGAFICHLISYCQKIILFIFCVVYPKKSLQTILSFFPTCQVRVIRSYQSCSPSSSQSRSQPRLPDRSGHCRTPTANSRAQWALPDLNGEFQIAVGTAGPQPRLPGCSGHCRTSTATSRSQWALPDFNRDFQVAMCTAGPRPRAPDPSGHYRTSTAR